MIGDIPEGKDWYWRVETYTRWNTVAIRLVKYHVGGTSSIEDEDLFGEVNQPFTLLTWLGWTWERKVRFWVWCARKIKKYRISRSISKDVRTRARSREALRIANRQSRDILN